MASALTRSMDTSAPVSRDTQVSCFWKYTQITSTKTDNVTIMFFFPLIFTRNVLRVAFWKKKPCVAQIRECDSKGSGEWAMTKAFPGEFATNKGVEGQLASEYTHWLWYSLTLPLNPPPGASTRNLCCSPIQRIELPGIGGGGRGGLKDKRFARDLCKPIF